jgi:hypothetical protein
MFRKHSYLCLLFAALLLVLLAACGKGGDAPKPSGAGQSAGQGQTAGNDASQPAASEGAAASGSQSAQPAKLSGQVRLIQLDDRDPSILRGVRITGIHLGTAEGFNGRESSLTDVRCIFQMNEWIEFYPDTDAKYDLQVWVLRHRDDPAYYNTCTFSDLMPGFANYCDLHYPADEENPEEWYWGNFYLHPEECEPGYYDFVFTYEGKAIATLLTRFYNVGELSAKTDAELEALMRE